MDSINRIFGLVNEAKKSKGKGKAMIPTHKETPGGKSVRTGKANPYDHDSFGMNEAKKSKKGLVGNQHRLDKNKDGKLTDVDFKMLRGESKEIITILNLIKEAYQDDLISEEAFLAIADPILRSLMEVTFPDTYEKEDLDDAEEGEKPKRKPKKTPMPTEDDYIAKHGEREGRAMYKRDGGKSSK